MAEAGRKQEAPPARGSRRWVTALIVLCIGGPVLLSLATAVVVKTQVQAFFLPSPSMEPTLNVRDRVLVNKLARDDIHRGDIIVFARPGNERGRIRDLIKRVVAVGGDTVESQGDQLIVNGRPVAEPYVKAGMGGAVRRAVVPPGHLYVLGDNRTNSSDSRVFGPIPEGSVVGRVFLRIWGSGGLKRF